MNWVIVKMALIRELQYSVVLKMGVSMFLGYFLGCFSVLFSVCFSVDSLVWLGWCIFSLFGRVLPLFFGFILKKWRGLFESMNLSEFTLKRKKKVVTVRHASVNLKG